MVAIGLFLFALFVRRSVAFNAGPFSSLRTRRAEFFAPASFQDEILLRHGRPYRPYMDSDADSGDSGGELEKDRSTERPTLVDSQPERPAVGPSKPKVLVLGASGLIGRKVVQTFLDMPHLDVTVVAFVRDYDKACRVLYDDLLVSNSRKKGPKLQIVHGDLVPPEELPGFQGDDEEEEQVWLEKAESAATFYANRVDNYDNRGEHDHIAPDEALEHAIRDCTTIISCVGSVRPTNFWTDIIARPVLRLLRKDVSGWCDDPRHPFYVHYHTTRKALRLAEREQLRREAVAACLDEDHDEDKEAEAIPRIRFIRISDLCVAHQPWQFVPLLTNILHSMVFRYQDMAEKILEASSLIETVTLRPGDLVDDERDLNTTALQVDPGGSVPSPARVGREDVAALAVASALFNSNRRIKDDDSGDDAPFHYTLACRWVGDQMDPYPAQGKMSEGHPDATLALQAALKRIRRDEKRRRRRHAVQAKTYPENALRIAKHVKTAPRKVKPYFLCTAVPVYFILSMMLRSVFYYLSPYIPGANYMKPIFSQGSDALAMAFGFVLGQLRALPARLPESIPNWLFFRARGSAKYNIPF